MNLLAAIWRRFFPRKYLATPRYWDIVVVADGRRYVVGGPFWGTFAEARQAAEVRGEEFICAMVAERRTTVFGSYGVEESSPN